MAGRAKGNDKGNVEGMIGFGRRNYMVPMPCFESFEALSACLEAQCLKRQDEVLRGYAETVGQRLLRYLDAMMALLAVPYDACDKISTRATSISMVRYRGNDYSVPVAYAHREVQVRGYVGEVVIGCGADVIARHRRSYEKADMIFDPIHFLPLLEQKVGALDQAAPLQGRQLRGHRRVGVGRGEYGQTVADTGHRVGAHQLPQLLNRLQQNSEGLLDTSCDHCRAASLADKSELQ